MYRFRGRRGLTLCMPSANEKPASCACRFRCLSCFMSLNRESADMAFNKAELPLPAPLPKLSCLLWFPDGVCGREPLRLFACCTFFVKKVTSSPVLWDEFLKFARKITTHHWVPSSCRSFACPRHAFESEIRCPIPNQNPAQCCPIYFVSHCSLEDRRCMQLMQDAVPHRFLEVSASSYRRSQVKSLIER